MRVLTAYSQDENMTNAFNNGRDLHCLTGSAISDFTYDDLKAHKEDKLSEQYLIRQLGKRVNFGTVYCMGAMTMKQKIWEELRHSITEEEAQSYLDGFFKMYPGVAQYIEDTHCIVQLGHFAPTYTGHRRRFYIMDVDSKLGSRLARQAVNARIQTTSSDLVCYNLLDIDKYVRPLGGRILLTVHDSIVFQLPKGTSGVKAAIDAIMLDRTAERAPWLPVKWKYDIGMGENYGNAHDDVN